MVELLPSMWEALGSVTCTRNLDMSVWVSSLVNPYLPPRSHSLEFPRIALVGLSARMYIQIVLGIVQNSPVFWIRVARCAV